jgi:hypothetical protein
LPWDVEARLDEGSGEMAPSKRTRQFYWGWQFIGLTVLMAAIYVLVGKDIIQGKADGEDAAILAIFTIGYIVVVLLLRHMRRKGEI